jgi:hypothetical protein
MLQVLAPATNLATEDDEEIVDLLEDIELNAIADAREGQPITKVDFASL